MFAVSKEKGQSMAPGTDVCKVPAPPGPPIPTPFPNTAMMTMGDPASKKVLINGVAALTKASKVATSNGDQAGSIGGLISGKIMGPMTFVKGSEKVKIEGQAAERMGDPTQNNDKNTQGIVLQPSQNKVIIQS